MALTATGAGPGRRRAPGLATDVAIWHEVECGGYRADLPLWISLAARAIPRPGSVPILDIGAGTGRVALALARAGHRVTAVEADRDLADALIARTRGLAVTVVVADARELSLDGERHGLAIVAMQTAQLMGGARGRRGLLVSSAAALRPRAMLACAIVEELELFDAAAGDEPADPDTLELDGARYQSRATRVARQGRRMVIERERTVLASGAPTVVRRHLDRLDVLSAERLEDEGARAGLRVLERTAVPTTDEHAGSTVVMLGA
jgi:SAM-dependent methyltransferase